MAANRINDEQLFELVTEALRAGPGTPAWQDATNAIGEQPADDYLALLEARDRLESGRKYRSVRAGAGFTRKVMEAVEKEGPRPSSRPGLWTLVFVVSAVLVLVGIGVIGYLIKPVPRHPSGMLELNQKVFTNTIVNTSLDKGSEIPKQWDLVGDMPLAIDRSAGGLRPTAEARDGNFRWGGILSHSPIDISRTGVYFEVTIRTPKLSGAVVEVFVTDDPALNPETGRGKHEWVWALTGKETKVILPSGGIVASGEVGDSSDLMTVRLAMNDTAGYVEQSGNRLWQGEYQLAAEKPRYVGVRFLNKGLTKEPQVLVQSVRIMSARN